MDKNRTLKHQLAEAQNAKKIVLSSELSRSASPPFHPPHNDAQAQVRAYPDSNRQSEITDRKRERVDSPPSVSSSDVAPEATRPLLAPLAKKTKIEQKKGRVSLAPGVYPSSAYDDDEEGEKDGDIANTLDGGASTRRGSAAASKSFVKLEDNWDAKRGGMTAAELKSALTAMDVELAEIYATKDKKPALVDLMYKYHPDLQNQSKPVEKSKKGKRG